MNNCFKNQYILEYNVFHELETCSVQVENVTINKNITNSNNIITNITGFTGIIENAGCSGDNLTQENHILQPIGGSVSPKNIVLRTDGSNNIYGSFFRDDTLTLKKGDIRGSGANDLSVSREECSQVASGDFSSILGGKNNTASGELSIVAGGDGNEATGEGSIVIGGSENSCRGSDSVIISGNNNIINPGTTGMNMIGSGNDNQISGSYNVILNGSNNKIDASQSSFNVILGGQDNFISLNSYNSMIGVGKNNINKSDMSVIVSGKENIIERGGSGGNFIGSGVQNKVFGTLNGIFIGQNNTIDGSGSIYNCILGGTSNKIRTNVSNSFIGTGKFNDISGSNCAIIAGTSNTALNDNNVIVNGTRNFIYNGNYNTILNGLTNSIDISGGNSYFSSITGGDTNKVNNSSNSMIGAGNGNLLQSSPNSCIVGGLNNQLYTDGSGGNFIGSGAVNILSGSYNAIISGINHIIDGSGSRMNCILSGDRSRIGNNVMNSVIGSGISNQIFSHNSYIGAGSNNVIQSDILGFTGGNFIGSGNNNNVSGSYNSIISGTFNIIDSSGSSNNCIVSGNLNRISSNVSNSLIGSGLNNVIISDNSVIVSGVGNTGLGSRNFIGSGGNHLINGSFNGIVSGISNVISSNTSYSMIGAGSNNRISSSNSFIGSGEINILSANGSSIICGSNNQLLGPTGINSCIAGGINNIISIPNSIAIGSNLSLTNPNASIPSAAFGSYNLEGSTGTGATAGQRIFMVGIGNIAQRQNGFSVNEVGLCVANSAFASGGADFAEYFESYDVQNGKLPCGETVCLIDQRFIGYDLINRQFVQSDNGFKSSDVGKILLASKVPEFIEPIGVIVIQSGFIGNSNEEEWHGKYEKDEYGNPIYETIVEDHFVEEVETYYEPMEIKELQIKSSEYGEMEEYIEVTKTINVPNHKPILKDYPLYDSNGNFLRMITKSKMKKISKFIKVQKLSQNYDSNRIYIPRSQRPEWNLVALMGQVLIKNGQRLNHKWIGMKSYNDQTTFYLIK